MPTANEIDNRPMAVGKWPRHRDHHHSSAGVDRYSHRQRRKCSVDENCLHNYGNLCLDVLLMPELLNEIYGERSILNSSLNPLLEFCLDGGQIKNVEVEMKEELSPILELCSEFSASSNLSWQHSLQIKNNFLQSLKDICQNGCDINVQSKQGYTAMHYIYNGCNLETFPDVVEATKILLHHGLDISIEDNSGNDCLTSIGGLLDRGLFVESLELSKLLLERSKCNPNHLNKSGFSLLSYSTAQGDATIDLTRLLLNHGASVWPSRSSFGDPNYDVTLERSSSAFTSFLRSVMRSQDLSKSWQTLKILCDVMGVEPEFMRTHVLSTMLHLGQMSNGATNPSMANLFVELKDFMAPYWRQPPTLRYLCINKIREALGPKNIMRGTQKLTLPSSLICHLHLN